MTNEEFQKLVLEKLASVATKEDISRLEAKIDLLAEEGQKDVIAMLTLVNGKLDKQAEILKILSSRSIEQEAEITVLKKVR